MLIADKLWGSACKSKIRMPENIPMGGYMDRTKNSIGVHDDLFTRCLALSNGENTFVIISNDLLSVDGHMTEMVRKALGKEKGIPEKNIMVCATHTHSGPDAIPWDIMSVNERTIDKMKDIKEMITRTIIDNSLKCLCSLTHVRMGISKTDCSEVAGNRIDSGNNCDTSLNIISIVKNTGEPIAFVINYACHPTVLSAENLLISGDYPGALQLKFEKAYRDSVALFINGACGNQSTRFTRRKQDFEEVERLGEILFNKAKASFNSIELMEEPYLLESASRKFIFPKKILPSREKAEENFKNAESAKISAIKKGLSNGDIRVAVTRYQGALLTMRMIDTMKSTEEIQSEIQILRIGDIEIVGVPVELFAEYGLDLKRRSKAKYTLVAGYANEVLGYVYTGDALRDGSYEALASPFSPDAGDFIVNKALEMEEALF